MSGGPRVAEKDDFGKLADTLISLKLCVHCGHQFTINKENRAICPKCGKR